MASRSMGQGPASEWQSSGHLHTRNQMMAFLRAAVIAAVLLAILALIILF
jgi:hypothetical protein